MWKLSSLFIFNFFLFASYYKSICVQTMWPEMSVAIGYTVVQDKKLTKDTIYDSEDKSSSLTSLEKNEED